jgi:hypothetical protein
MTPWQKQASSEGVTQPFRLTYYLWQAEERKTIEEQSRIIAFDRQNHMGATDNIARTITTALQAEAEHLLADRTLINGAVTIQENAERMKVLFLLLAKLVCESLVVCALLH